MITKQTNFYLQQKQIYFKDILKACETKDSYENELINLHSKMSQKLAFKFSCKWFNHHKVIFAGLYGCLRRY